MNRPLATREKAMVPAARLAAPAAMPQRAGADESEVHKQLQRRGQDRTRSSYIILS